MKLVRSLFGLHYTDIAPQVAVYRVFELFRRKLAVIETHIRYLAFSVNPCVRPPRTDHADLSIRDHPDHTLKLALDRPVVFLHLPAVKIGAVVLY